LVETSDAPCAACCTLRAISCAAAPCTSTDAATDEAISAIVSMVAPISLIEPTDCWVAAWIWVTWRPISSVALAVCPASAFTSDPTPRNAPPRLTRARRFDGGVQRKQVGLLGDGRDHLDDFTDTIGGLRQCLDLHIGPVGLLDGGERNLLRLRDLAPDFADR